MKHFESKFPPKNLFRPEASSQAPNHFEKRVPFMAPVFHSMVKAGGCRSILVAGVMFL